MSDIHSHGSADPLDLALTRRAFVTRAAAAAVTIGAGSSLLTQGARAATRTRVARSATNVTILNILAPQLGYAAEYIADIKGYYTKNGLNVTVQTSRGSAPAIQALISNQGMLTSIGSMETIIHAANEGVPLRSIAIREHRAPVALISSNANPFDDADVARRQDDRHPVRRRHERADAERAAQEVQHPDRTGEAAGDGLRAGHVRADQAGPHRRLHHRGYADGSVPGADPGSRLPAVRQVRARQLRLRHDTGPDQAEPPADAGLPPGCPARGCSTSLPTRSSTNYANTLAMLRAHYDFEELKDDRVAKSWLDYLTVGWLYQGQKFVLKPEVKRFHRIYDQLVDNGVVKAGQNPYQWLNNHGRRLSEVEVAADGH